MAPWPVAKQQAVGGRNGDSSQWEAPWAWSLVRRAAGGATQPRSRLTPAGIETQLRLGSIGFRVEYGSLFSAGRFQRDSVYYWRKRKCLTWTGSPLFSAGWRLWRRSAVSDETEAGRPSCLKSGDNLSLYEDIPPFKYTSCCFVLQGLSQSTWPRHVCRFKAKWGTVNIGRSGTEACSMP